MAAHTNPRIIEGDTEILHQQPSKSEGVPEADASLLGRNHLGLENLPVRGKDLKACGSQAGLSVFLAILVLAAFVLPSMGLAENDEGLYFNVAFSLLLILGISIAWRRRTLFVLLLMVGLPAVAFQWVTQWAPSSGPLGLWRQGMTLASSAMIVVVQALEVFRSGPVTHMRIEGAIAVYLLLGMGWAHAYHMVGMLNPHSFAGFDDKTPAISTWMYYSFVTLTTLGYGEIVPIRPVARSLAVGEALTGQLYLTVLLARLIALQVGGGGNRSSTAE